MKRNGKALEASIVFSGQSADNKEEEKLRRRRRSRTEESKAYLKENWSIAKTKTGKLDSLAARKKQKKNNT